MDTPCLQGVSLISLLLWTAATAHRPTNQNQVPLRLVS